MQQVPSEPPGGGHREQPGTVRCVLGSDNYGVIQSIPLRHTEGSAGLDLSTTKEEILFPFTHKLIPLGISIEIPKGYVGLLFPRSSLWKNYRVLMVNSVGVIDSDYRGELMIQLLNPESEGQSQDPIRIPKGTRVAQLVIIPCITPKLIPVDTLEETKRGTSGFGSTG